jgi:eukaryotic-like serine/threonine-protein kinase
MAKPRQCPECGAPLPTEALGGACPFCALRSALNHPADEAGPDSLAEQPGDRIGPYKLLEQIGEGGWGVVYMADQVEPIRRRVALKIVKLGMDTKQVIARFDAERQALALMDHPNIARVLDAGATATGRPYFVMELVRGIKITDYCDQNQLSTQERLDLFMQVCHAVQHAHQKGIIHRDLKPSNILVTLHDGVAVPKVIDFGIAKATQQPLTDKTLFTSFQHFIGTPAYMSPEQAGMSGLDIDTRSDIYALGVLLYELLTSRLPFEQKELARAGLDEMRRLIREQEPPRPSTRLSTLADAELSTTARQRQTEPLKLVKHVRGDLAWIVMRCLEKDRARRYSTADALADDLTHHLNHEPVEAAAPGAFYRLSKFAQRHRTGLATGTTLLLLLLGGVLVSTWQAIRATRAERDQSRLSQEARAARVEADSQRRSAEEGRQRFGEALTKMQMQKAEELFSGDNLVTALAYLAAVLRRDPTNQSVAERIVSALTYRNLSLPVSEPLHHDGAIHSARFSPDGRMVVTASADTTARVWDANTGQPLTQPLKHEAPVRFAEFGPDGECLVTACTNLVYVWELRTGRTLYKLIQLDAIVWLAKFSPDGARIVTACSDKTARIWDTKTGRPLVGPLQHEGMVSSAQFSPDGLLVVTASIDKTARVWDARTGQPVTAPLRHEAVLRSAEFGLDSRRLVTTSTNTAQIWDARSGLRLGNPLSHVFSYTYAPVLSAQFNPSGTRVVTASGDRTAIIWAADTGRPVTQTPPHHDRAVSSAQFSPEGLRVVTASSDNTARVWDARTAEPLTEALPHNGEVNWAQFSPDGRKVLTASLDGTARLWDVRPGQALTLAIRQHTSDRYAEFSPNGTSLLTAAGDGTARVWDLQTGQPRGRTLQHTAKVNSARFSPDGQRLVTASADFTARVWDALSGEPLTDPLRHESAVLFARFSPDGQRVVTASADKTAMIWAARSGQRLLTLNHDAGVCDAQFSPEGRRVLTASADTTARIWDAQTGQPLAQPLRHAGNVHSARFSPDGRRVVTGSGDNTSRIWDADTGRLLAEVRHSGLVYDAEFSSDGRCIATASFDGTARVWDAQTGHPLTEPLKQLGRIYSVRFSPDGQRLVTAGTGDVHARIWDVRTGQLTAVLKHDVSLASAEFSPDGRQVVTVSSVVRIWDVPHAPLPVPRWFAELAEAVGRQRLHENGRFEPVAWAELFRLKHEIERSPSEDFYTLWAQWFLADRATRTISPFSSLTVPQYVERRIQDGTLESLQEAVQLSPTNGLALAALARCTLAQQTMKTAQRLAEAEFFCRLAVRSAPEAKEVLRAKAEVATALGEWTQLTQEQRQGAGFWATNGMGLERSDRLQEARQAYSKAIELASADPATSAKERRDYLASRFKLLCRLDEREAAMLDLDKMISLTPTNNAGALNNLAWELVTGPEKCRWPAKALPLAEAAVELQPDYSHWDTLGVVYYRLGQWMRALEALESALASSSTPSSCTLFFLAMTYQQLGQAGRAEDHYRQAVLKWKVEARGSTLLDAIFAEADAARGKSEKAKLDNQALTPSPPASK